MQDHASLNQRAVWAGGELIASAVMAQALPEQLPQAERRTGRELNLSVERAVVTAGSAAVLSEELP